MTPGVRPSFVLTHSPTSKLAPSRQLANDGDANRELRAAARAARSLRLRKSSMGKAPIVSVGDNPLELLREATREYDLLSTGAELPNGARGMATVECR